MYQILSKQTLNPFVTRVDIHAPLVARKAEPGQFVILRVDADGERIPLTIADFDREQGTVAVIFQIVGATTAALNRLAKGDCIHDFVGPLGKATETDGLKKVAVVGGGVGCAIAWPIARKLRESGCEVHTVTGFRNHEMVILADAFEQVSHRFILMTDDGSAGEQGLVTSALERLIDSGERYDAVITIGPLIMMKHVCNLTRNSGIRTIASMNPVMIDGTGMCGGCRLTVGGKTMFACVDGPDFDGHEVDFNEALSRAAMYADQERMDREMDCRLFRQEVGADA